MMEREQSKRTRIIGLRLTLDEYAKIKAAFEQSTSRQLSEYVRRMVFGKPVTVYTRDRSLDDFMHEMMHLRKELNSVGVNFNQAVRKLNALARTDEVRAWVTSYEMDRRSLLHRMEIIEERISKMGDRWLQ